MTFRERATAFIRRLRGFDDDDLQAEIQAHLDIAAADRMADGVDHRRARQDAVKDFGNVTLTREAARRIWTPRWLEVARDYASDVRYAVRALARTPGFSLTVVVVLTLGIGLNAAAFTMLKSMAVNPLSGVARSSKIAVMFGETGTGRELRVSYPDYQYLRDHDTSFVEMFGSSLVTAGLGRGRAARSIWTELVTGNYFRVLGVTAQRGRVLGPDDDGTHGRQAVVVLSDALWRRGFDADPAIVGKSIEMSHQMLTVVGVADPTFHGTIVGYDVEAFAPITMAAPLGVTGGSTLADPLSDRDAGMLFPHGFLRPGVTPAIASAKADAAWASLVAGRQVDGTAQHLRVVPFPESPTGAQQFLLSSLLLLTVMGLLVLLIACANIAGLVLVRGVSRRGEIAVRMALGAGRPRIVRMLVVENLVLALPGAVLGVILAQRSIPFLAAYAQQVAQPSRLFFNVGVDESVIAFSVVVGVASALVFGFVPALQASRVDLVSVITQDASPRGSARGRFRSSLVIAQVAVSLLLLIGAGLVARTLEAVRTAYPGFDATNVTAIGMDVRQNAYTEADGRAFYHRLLETVRADPAVESADLAAFGPLALIDTPSKTVSIEGYTPRRDEDLGFMFNAIAGEYFRTLHIPLEAGRAFSDHDDEAGARVIIVNDTLARRFWGGAAQAIGRRMSAGDGTWRTVIGVAQDIKYLRINEPPRPYFYLPLFQSYRTAVELNTRGTASAETLATRARDQVASLDADLPVLFAKPLADRIAGTRIIFKLTALMLLIFGSTGMILAGLGTYGLVSYTVRQSTHEIGIRLALGASAMSVVRNFMSRGLRLGAIGAAIGLVIALAAGRLIESALFGVSATDPGSFTRALAIVFGGVLIATLLPAWRASRTDPLRALRRQ